MTKPIFKIGDTVYCKLYGKGVVSRICNIDTFTYPVRVKFENKNEYYTLDGRLSTVSDICLSFTPWKEQPNHIRPIDYNEYIGKLGAFWDDGSRDEFITTGYLDSYNQQSPLPFCKEAGVNWEHFTPLEDQDFVKKLKNK